MKWNYQRKKKPKQKIRLNRKMLYFCFLLNHHHHNWSIIFFERYVLTMFHHDLFSYFGINFFSLFEVNASKWPPASLWWYPYCHWKNVYVCECNEMYRFFFECLQVAIQTYVFNSILWLVEPKWNPQKNGIYFDILSNGYGAKRDWQTEFLSHTHTTHTRLKNWKKIEWKWNDDSNIFFCWLYTSKKTL